jgi:hypothetical protein
MPRIRWLRLHEGNGSHSLPSMRRNWQASRLGVYVLRWRRFAACRSERDLRPVRRGRPDLAHRRTNPASHARRLATSAWLFELSKNYCRRVGSTPRPFSLVAIIAAMAAAVLDLRCNVCGETHTFCLPDADMFTANAEYDYTCPKQNLAARIQVESWHPWNESTIACPPRSVILREVR